VYLLELDTLRVPQHLQTRTGSVEGS
jgi:hypothetical protein